LPAENRENIIKSNAEETRREHANCNVAHACTHMRKLNSHELTGYTEQAQNSKKQLNYNLAGTHTRRESKPTKFNPTYQRNITHKHAFKHQKTLKGTQ
jgi:hypothetical protein